MKIKAKENYIWGIIGAIISGTLVATLVAYWYINANITGSNAYIQLLLGILHIAPVCIVPIIEFWIYKLCRGKIDKKSKIILIVTSVVAIIIMATLVMPIALLKKAEQAVNLTTIKSILSDRKLFIKIMEDFFVALALTGLGLYFVNSKITKKLLLKVDNIKLFSKDVKENTKYKEEAIKEIKPIFEKFEATTRNRTITKEELLAEDNSEQISRYFKYLRDLNIIRTYNGKYYYCSSNEKNIKQKNIISKIFIPIIVTIATISIIIFAFGIITKANATIKVSNKDITFKVGDEWVEDTENKEKNQWQYYRGVATEAEESEKYKLQSLSISYRKEANQSIDQVQSMMVSFVGSLYQYDVKKFTTNKKYDAFELIIYTEDNDVVYNFYITHNGQLAIISAMGEKDAEETEELEEKARNIANNFEWHKK